MEISENDVYNLFVYYYQDKVNVSLTIKDFVNFVNNEVLTNNDYSSNIPKSAKDALSTLNKFLDKNTITKSMNSTEMANLFGMDKNTIDSLYLYYYSIHGVDNKLSINEFANFVINNVLTNSQYASQFDSNTVGNLKLLQTMSNTSIIDKNMNSTELSSLFGIDENIVKQLLLLKYTTTDNGTTLTIAEYIDFVNYLKNNTNYLDGVDISAINKIAVFAKNENNMNSTKMNKVQLSYIFNNVSNGLVDNVYVGLQLPDDYQMSPQEFISLVIDKISGSIEESSLNNLKLLKLIVDDSSKPSKYTATQIANVLGMNTKQTYQIYGLYDYTKGNTTNWKQTPYQFVKFIIDNSSNPQISTNMNKENLSQLQMAYTIMSSTKNNLKYSYSELSNSVGMKNLGIAGLVVGSIALVGFGVYKIVKNFNKDKEIKMPKSITEFHKKLNKYLEEANKGILNVDSIDDVLKAIDEIERLKDPNIKIDFSTKEVRDLLNSVYKFTTKLNKEDKHNKIKFKAPSKNSKDNVVCLKDYLKYQKELVIAG